MIHRLYSKDLSWSIATARLYTASQLSKNLIAPHPRSEPEHFMPRDKAGRSSYRALPVCMFPCVPNSRDLISCVEAKTPPSDQTTSAWSSAPIWDRTSSPRHIIISPPHHHPMIITSHSRQSPPRTAPPRARDSQHKRTCCVRWSNALALSNAGDLHLSLAGTWHGRSRCQSWRLRRWSAGPQRDPTTSIDGRGFEATTSASPGSSTTHIRTACRIGVIGGGATCQLGMPPWTSLFVHGHRNFPPPPSKLHFVGVIAALHDHAVHPLPAPGFQLHLAPHARGLVLVGAQHARRQSADFTWTLSRSSKTRFNRRSQMASTPSSAPRT